MFHCYFHVFITANRRFLFSAWFAYLALKSYKAEDNPVKKSLFLKLGLFYFPWVFGNPFVFFLTLILDPWVRDITIAAVELILTLAGYSFLGFLLWPSRVPLHSLSAQSHHLLSSSTSHVHSAFALPAVSLLFALCYRLF